MSDPRITLRTPYLTLKTNFSNSHAFRAAGNPLGTPHNDFPYSALEALVPTAGVSAVVIYFGMIGSDLRYGIRIVEMKPTGDPNVFDLDPVLSGGAGQDPSHVLDNGAFVPLASFGTHWQGMYSAYYDNVVVDRTGHGAFVALDPAQDPKAVVLPWQDEVHALWTDNREVIGELPSRIVISSLARNHVGDVGYNGPDGYRHCVGLHIQVNVRGTWTDVLDDSDPTPPSYRNHGADFGNCCPPMCAEYSAPNV